MYQFSWKWCTNCSYEKEKQCIESFCHWNFYPILILMLGCEIFHLLEKCYKKVCIPIILTLFTKLVIKILCWTKCHTCDSIITSIVIKNSCWTKCHTCNSIITYFNSYQNFMLNQMSYMWQYHYFNSYQNFMLNQMSYM